MFVFFVCRAEAGNLRYYTLYYMQEAQDIVQIRHHHEQQQNANADILGVYHEVLRRLAASYHLVEQEEHVSAVERRDGQNVHEGEDDAQEGGHKPERVPVPLRREQTADGSEAAERLGAFRREEILHVAHVAREHLAAVLDAGGERLEEAVVDVCHLILGLLRHVAEHKTHRLALGERRETRRRTGLSA